MHRNLQRTVDSRVFILVPRTVKSIHCFIDECVTSHSQLSFSLMSLSGSVHIFVSSSSSSSSSRPKTNHLCIVTKMDSKIISNKRSGNHQPHLGA